SAAGHLLLGEALLKLGRTQEAETELRTAIALDAENVHARARLADLLRNGGRLDEAEACLREALAIDAESPAAIFGLALVQRERGQPDAAIEHLEHALRLDPGRGGQTLQQLADMLRYADQGLGDEIMYGSCIRDLVARARHVALECNPKLGQLFARSFAPCTVTPRARTMANDWVNHLEPRPDYQVPIGSLPLHFRGRL